MWWTVIIVWSWKLLGQPTFDERVRVDVLGEVTQVATPLIEKQPALDITLKSERSRFRIPEFSYARELHARVPTGLAPGARVRVVVEKSAYGEPEALSPNFEPTVSVDALDVDGKVVLALADSRRLDAESRRVAWLVLSVISAIALGWSIALARRLWMRRA